MKSLLSANERPSTGTDSAVSSEHPAATPIATATKVSPAEIDRALPSMRRCDAIVDVTSLES